MSGYTQGRRDGYEAAVDALLPYYSAALDEIYRLRVALAVEAEAQSGNLNFKTFPKSQRLPTAQSIARMKAAAIGERPERYRSLSVAWLDDLFASLGGNRLLTRDIWEREVDRVSGGSGTSGVTPND
jgi:hypothetical protein